jgi:hypothetical protein
MNTTTPTYPHAPGYKVSGTSRDAAVAVIDRACTLRERVYDVLVYSPSTADECAAMLGESVLSIRPRLSELLRMGKIENTGLRRKNASGHSASVWRARP